LSHDTGKANGLKSISLGQFFKDILKLCIGSLRSLATRRNQDCLRKPSSELLHEFGANDDSVARISLVSKGYWPDSEESQSLIAKKDSVERRKNIRFQRNVHPKFLSLTAPF